VDQSRGARLLDGDDVDEGGSNILRSVGKEKEKKGMGKKGRKEGWEWAGWGSESIRRGWGQ